MNKMIGTSCNEISYKGKRVFLTGGSRGIGRTLKLHFEALGADVEAPGREQLDLSSRESISQYLKRKMDFDIFVHCAGKNELASVTEIQSAVLDDCFQVNYYSAVELLKAITPHMSVNGNGKVLFISSLYAIVSRERRLAYSSSKNALTGLMKTAALELAPAHIMVNAIAPGYVMTEMTRKNLSGEELAAICGNIPTGELQSEEDISNLAVFLCSEFNQNITGQLIAVDGGFLCR